MWSGLPTSFDVIRPVNGLFSSVSSTETPGWGGRLSGPNDGARNDIQVGSQVMKNQPDSSCMICYGPAGWQPEQHKMLSFLLPSFPNP